MAAIDTLLEQTVAGLKHFLAVIARERRMLVTSNIDQLPEIAKEKSALATRLANLDTQRDAALEAAGFGTGRPGVDAWLAANPATSLHSPRNTWTLYIDLATEAKRENELNGKLIGARLQQNQQAIAMLRGESDTATYGADGQRNASSGKRPLGSA